jgi:hypothetical protein
MLLVFVYGYRVFTIGANVLALGVRAGFEAQNCRQAAKGNLKNRTQNYTLNPA